MITFEILDSYRSQIDPLILKEAAITALQQRTTPSDPDLTIVITDDEQLQLLNRQYRDIDAPTDVLSFPADFTDPESERPYLGDIIISYPRATIQAETGGHPILAELQLLVVHGVLHLLGHDHADPEEKAQMWAAQADVMCQLGLETIIITGDR